MRFLSCALALGLVGYTDVKAPSPPAYRYFSDSARPGETPLDYRARALTPVQLIRYLQGTWQATYACAGQRPPAATAEAPLILRGFRELIHVEGSEVTREISLGDRVVLRARGSLSVGHDAKSGGLRLNLGPGEILRVDAMYPAQLDEWVLWISPRPVDPRACARPTLRQVWAKLSR